MKGLERKLNYIESLKMSMKILKLSSLSNMMMVICNLTNCNGFMSITVRKCSEPYNCTNYNRFISMTVQQKAGYLKLYKSYYFLSITVQNWICTFYCTNCIIFMAITVQQKAGYLLMFGIIGY